jgi:hypothetical protein
LPPTPRLDLFQVLLQPSEQFLILTVRKPALDFGQGEMDNIVVMQFIRTKLFAEAQSQAVQQYNIAKAVSTPRANLVFEFMVVLPRFQARQSCTLGSSSLATSIILAKPGECNSSCPGITNGRRFYFCSYIACEFAAHLGVNRPSRIPIASIASCERPGEASNWFGESCRTLPEKLRASACKTRIALKVAD